MKYFAMIDGQQYGPMMLDDMVKEGVRPDTYVWHKGLPDWIKASEDPDICRYFRQRLSGTLPLQNTLGRLDAERRREMEAAEQEELLNQLPPMARGYVRKSGVKLSKEDFRQQDRPPLPKALPIILYAISIIMIIIGFLIIK